MCSKLLAMGVRGRPFRRLLMQTKASYGGSERKSGPGSLKLPAFESCALSRRHCMEQNFLLSAMSSTFRLLPKLNNLPLSTFHGSLLQAMSATGSAAADLAAMGSYWQLYTAGT